MVEKSLRAHIAQVEQQKRDCEEEIGKLKALLVSERMKAEEELSQTRLKLKNDQVCTTFSSTMLTALIENQLNIILSLLYLVCHYVYEIS